MQEGGPGYLANFLWKISKNPNPNGVDGFPLCFEGFFWRLLMKLRCCIFAGGRPRALSTIPLKTPKTPNLNWVDEFPLCFGGFFLILPMKLRCYIFAGGRSPRVLSKFPLENQQKSKSPLGKWISPIFWDLFSGFCLRNCVIAFLQEGGPWYPAFRQ